MRTLFRVLFLTCVLGTWCNAQVQPLKIYWIDVEGGGSSLIVTPAGQSILIDAGGYVPERDSARVFVVARQVAGLKDIDMFIATHWHADHYGGLAALVKLMPVKSFYGNGPLPDAVPEDVKFPVLMPAYKQATQGRTQLLHPGEKLPLKQAAGAPQIELICLGADGNAIPPKPGEPPNPRCAKQAPRPDPSQNAKSVALKLTYGKFSFFDGGDLTWDKEAQLVCPTNRVGTIDLFQVNHHGLDLSSNPELLESASPRVLVINNGPDKGPEANCWKTVKSLKTVQTIWQVHRNVKNPPGQNTEAKYIANNDANCKAQYIQAQVQANGAYSVQIGKDGTRQEYGPR